MNKFVLPITAIILIATIVWLLYATWLQPGHSAPAPDESGAAVYAQQYASTTPLIRVRDQAAGPSVLIEAVGLPRAGWVVVHEMIGSHIGNALGAARRDAGVHSLVSVELLRNTATTSPYAVILYEDDGDREFELRTDLPILAAEGDPLIAMFTTQ